MAYADGYAGGYGGFPRNSRVKATATKTTAATTTSDG